MYRGKVDNQTTTCVIGLSQSALAFIEIFPPDWWTTLRGTTTDGGEFAIPKYYVGKYFWTSIKVFVFGETGGNPLPFADPGERSALEYTMGGTHFSQVFTEEWMKRECP
jgi:hypothetical protein